MLGVTRTYHLRLPSAYDPARPYPVIFRFHGFGGDGLSGGLDIEYASGEDAIIVAGDGIERSWNDPDSDVPFFDRMLDEVSAAYCVDADRVFAYGFSAGGRLTNRLGCVRGDVLRATASVASAEAEGSCVGQAAAWFLHDADDDAMLLAWGEAARDRVLAANGCGTATADVGDGCVRYEGCAEGMPVIWCQTRGYGHDIRGDYAPGAVWEFFRSLP